MSKTKIKLLPLHMKPIGEKLAHEHCLQMGLSEGSEKYKEEFNEYFYNFNNEAYGLSLTPSGLIGQNPGTPKVKEEFFRELKGIFGENGLISRLNTDAYTKQKYDRVLRGNFTSIAHFIMATNYDINIKRNEKNSAFEYGQSPSQSEKEVVIQNQYMRLYFITMVTKALEEILYTSSREDLSMANLFEEAFGAEYDENSNRLFTYLNNNEKRKQFVEHFYNKGKGLTQQNPKKEKSLKKDNPIIIDPVTSLSFDKNMVREFLMKADDSYVVGVKANPEHCKDYYCSEEEVAKADLTTPVLFGTVQKGKNVDNFVILGHDKIKKALKQGLPRVDAIILTIEETKEFIV